MMKKTMDETGKRIFIELGTHLQIEIKKSQMFLGSELIGMEVGKYLIVKTHEKDEDKRDALENKEIHVKYFHIDSILGFHAEVISLISFPDNLVFITYPHTVENCSVRSNPRRACFMSVKLEIEYNLVEGIMTDISEEGCNCEIKNFKIMDEQAQDKVIIYLQNTIMKREFPLLGKIKSIRQVEAGVKIGIVFDEMDFITQTMMKSVIPILDFK